MDKVRIKSAIEAILFAMGGPVEGKTLAQALDITPKQLKSAIDEMIIDYQSAERGVQIIELDGSYQMSTKSNAYEYLIKIVSIPRDYRLTDVQLETLSIIAYKQPVTKAEIEKIRGVSSDHAVNRLIEAGMVEEVGRLEQPGRPMLFGTTQEFLRRFGLANTQQLPDINTEQVELFKLEAEEEIGYKPEAAEAAMNVPAQPDAVSQEEIKDSEEKSAGE